jgi:hypothetical protein
MVGTALAVNHQPAAQAGPGSIPVNKMSSFVLCNVGNNTLGNMHCNENPIYVFLFWELRGHSPNFHIHVSVSDFYIPRVQSTYFLQQNRQIDCGNI